jgi:hypothetical protein
MIAYAVIRLGDDGLPALRFDEIGRTEEEADALDWRTRLVTPRWAAEHPKLEIRRLQIELE